MMRDLLFHDIYYFREARMHARRHHWTAYALIATVALAMGCRGSRPLASMVKISQQRDADLPEVDPPRQRLAVNKQARGEVKEGEQRPPVRDSNPHNRLVSDRKPVSDLQAKAATDKTRPASDTVNTLTDRRTPAAKPATAPTPSQTAAATKTAQSDVSAAARSSNSVGDMTEEEMTAAFESQPEEVKRLAMKQLIASLKRSAERTSQPEGLDSALANSMDHLPKLPPVTGTRSRLSARRIASPDSPANAAPPAKSVATTADTKTPPTPRAGGSVSDAGNPDLEPVVVQTFSDRPDTGSVQPVSASRDADETPKVAHASGLSSPAPAAERNAEEAATSDGEGTSAGSEVSVASGSPASTLPPGSEMSDKALYDELLSRLAKVPEGESEADRSSRLIKQRHLMVLAGNPDAAVQRIDAMSEAEQEFLRHQLLGLWTMVDPEGHPVPSRRFTTALPQIREATKFAAAATDSLEVRSLAFCTAIESYGQVKSFPGNRFEAGQQVILYCEVENFTVAENNEGYETHLQGSYDVYNANNEKVVSQLLPADRQVSANFLRDYFIAYQMHLPQQLSAGTYRLQLTMEDVTGKKYGQANIPFEIAK